MKRTILVCLLVGAAPALGPDDRAERLRVLRERARSEVRDFEAALTLACDRVDEHFRIRAARIPGVVDELFSAKGKWRATFWSDADYERAATRLLARELFDGLPELTGEIALDLSAAAEASDNRLYEWMEVELNLPPPALDPGRLGPGRVGDLSGLAVRDGLMNGLSIAAGEIGGVFAATLAAGALSAGGTAGVGLVAAVVVSIAADAIWGDAFEALARDRIGLALSEVRREAMKRIGDAADAAVLSYLALREEAVIHAVERGGP